MFHSCRSIKYSCGDDEIDSRHCEMMDCIGEINLLLSADLPLNYIALGRLSEEFSELCSVHELAEQVLTIEHDHFFDHSLIFDCSDDLSGGVRNRACAREMVEIADRLHALVIADIITDRAEIRMHANDERAIGLNAFDFDPRPLHVEPVRHRATAT